MSGAPATVDTPPQAPTGPARGSGRRPRPHRPRQNNPQTTPLNGQSHTSPRGGRRGGGRQQNGLEAGQTSITHTPQQAEAPSGSDSAPGRGGRGGGRGRGRGRGRGGPNQSAGRQESGHTQNPPRMGFGGRQFGGQLTVEHAQQTSSDGQDGAGGDGQAGLNADAPAFQPGQPLVSRPRGPPLPQNQPRERRASKSTAPDIATRTHEDITNGHYECAICTEELKRSSKVWSCRTCWTVFHLGCIKKWSSKEGSAAAQQQVQDGETPPPRQWRCPGCNLPKDVLPKSFTCWCEKEIDPKSLPGLPPFSCGQTCSRPRILPKKCPHPCPSICHAGPCPPCTQMGPTQSCFCGKQSVTRRCVDTDYEHGWSCGNVCGEPMACGEHKCPRPCHDGPCGACKVRVPARCYCGQVEKDILCCDRGGKKQSSVSHVTSDGSEAIESWIGLFECANICAREFDCKKHRCEKPCHRQDPKPAHCPRSPDVVSHCPCGKTLLSDISHSVRRSCEDPISNCSKPCGKVLACGHPCQQLCHQGECRACLETVDITCRCGRTTATSICHQGVLEPPQCMRICRVSLNCGRHECGEHCCPGERKAAERATSRRKMRSINSGPRPADNFEAEHICTRPCGRALKCGNPDHRCQELCHKGACGTCRDAIFDEISCNCGRTVLQPPLPCGTQPPPCRFQCDRPKSCGHPQVTHNCHLDAEQCPKCPFLTTKSCLCGKNKLKNQPCWLTEVRCGEACGKLLKCGAHRCQKQCHRPGECEEPCRQLCGKELSVCGHPCMAPCHSPFPCKENKPCQHKILVTCDCQRIKQEAKCGAYQGGEGNLKKTLKCDEECARLERNRKLAVALNIDPATHQDDHIPYSATTLNFYVENSTWAAIQEKELRRFAADPDQKRLRFKPMPAHQRAFLHSISEDFGFDSESMDPAPHRHVAIFKTPRFVMAPMKTLAECARIRQIHRAANLPPSSQPQTATRAKPVVPADPYNAFLITNPKFGLMEEEVHSILKSALPAGSVQLEASFLPSEEVVLRPPLVVRSGLHAPDLQSMLLTMKPALDKAITAQKIGKLELARVDFSLNILRKESDSSSAGNGWSQVAAKAGAPKKPIPAAAPLGSRGGFAVLSLSSTKKKKEKEKKAVVVDDWEAAELEEEEKERAASAMTSADEARNGSGESSLLGSPETRAVDELEDMGETKEDSHGDLGHKLTRWSDLTEDE